MVTPRRASLAVLGFLVTFGAVRADQGLLGFSDERARAQRALERASTRCCARRTCASG